MFFEKKYKQSNISRWKDIDILGDFFHDEVAEWLRRWTANPYVIKFVSDLRQVAGFLRLLRFLPTRKLSTTI
jgi:hypothetical protein